MTGILFSVIGVVMLGVAWWSYSNSRDLAASGVRVTGTVASIRQQSDSDGTTYSPVYAYAHDGTPRTYSPSSSSSRRPRIGDTATLFVDPDDPTHVLADTFMDRWLLPVLIGGMGAVFLLAGVVTGVVNGARISTRSGSWSRGSVPPPPPPPDNLPHSEPDATTEASDTLANSVAEAHSGPFL